MMEAITLALDRDELLSPPPSALLPNEGVHDTHWVRWMTPKLIWTQWSRDVRPLDSFPAFNGKRKFNTEFTRALHLFLS
jgi:hypothetical protein